jgi:hypothetical protein
MSGEEFLGLEPAHIRRNDIAWPLPESVTHFRKLQWEFVPLKLREHAHKDIESERILPFVKNDKLSSGGFSDVYKVRIHPLYHDFKPYSNEQRE